MPKECFGFCHLSVHEYHLQKNYLNAFIAWIHRLKLYLSVRGEYFDFNNYKNNKKYFILLFFNEDDISF